MVKGAVAPLLINQASQDERFANHPGLTLYGIESYIAVPLLRRDGSYFGTLCALDPLPTKLSEDNFQLFNLLAQLIAFELEAEDEKMQRESEISVLNDIVSIAAHDLRQPLTALQLRLQMTNRRAKKENISSELLNDLNRLQLDVRRVISLTDTLLDIGRFQVGDFKLELVELDLVALILQTVENITNNKDTPTFDLKMPDSLVIKGDSVRLGRVIGNLLDNAFKYSQGSQKPIEVRLDSPTKSEIILQIRDYGIGVTESDLPNLFKRHYRTQEATASQVSGSGLGLYISQKIVEEHKGRIWAELPLGGGLLVKLSLPLVA